MNFSEIRRYLRFVTASMIDILPLSKAHSIYHIYIKSVSCNERCLIYPMYQIGQDTQLELALKSIKIKNILGPRRGQAIAKSLIYFKDVFVGDLIFKHRSLKVRLNLNKMNEWHELYRSFSH